MKTERNHHRQRQKPDLAHHKLRQVPAGGAGNSVLADRAEHKIPIVVVEMPLYRQQTIQYPQIEVLPAMKSQSWTIGRQAAENAQVDIRIVTGKIDIGVMQDGMLPVPVV